MKTNIAERIKMYYESEDFKYMYMDSLIENYHSNETEVLNRIVDIVQYGYYFEKRYGFNTYISKEQAKVIFQFISDHFESFCDDFRSYFVGETSLESVSFGEQEEQLTDIYNNQTGKSYGLKYIKQAFNNAGYYVSGNYAYLDLSSYGIHVDLLKGDLTESIINTIRKEETIAG